MGIRYYAFAFDGHRTEQVLADPGSVVSDDPLADAWGLPHGFTLGSPGFEQAVPHRDMLYLDKAWRHLQAVTAPPDDAAASSAHRMFEGDVGMHAMGWEPWVRTLVPEEVPGIARDLADIGDAEVAARLGGARRFGRDLEEEVVYATEYLGRARTFMSTLAAEGRGMVYTIG